MRTISKQKGLTLIEVLLGMALGVAALTAVTSLVGYGIGVNANLIASSRVNEETSNVLSLMVRDIRRAGYSGDTLDMLSDPAANPSPFADSITISALAGEAANSCILFSYDANNNGVLDGGANGENFGYRLRENTVEIRQGVATCEENGWLTLTDPDVVSIDALTFVMGQTIENGIPTTTITLNMQAELVTNDDVSRQFTTEILVRNYDG
ncbi:prepilin-type N-terminal cleavage/methylation domain-containing protein [Alteromonas sp. H39]|uniref:prepilin-type N-terminal cleavage/methylation domain-containing protein n=1 Tax=Alteromonas sp. H39 TaxID=3389876 RepID=UPI0039E14E19